MATATIELGAALAQFPTGSATVLYGGSAAGASVRDANLVSDLTSVVGNIVGSIGSIIGAMYFVPQYNGGSRPFLANGRPFGVTVPADQSGQTAVAEYVLPVSLEVASHLGARAVRGKLFLSHTANFEGVLTLGFNALLADGTIGPVPFTKQTTTQISSTQRLYEFDAILPGGLITALSMYYVLGTGCAGASLVLGDAYLVVTGSSSANLTTAQEHAEIAYLRGLDADNPVPGLFLADAAVGVQVFNGATFRFDARGRAMGYAVPAGQTGTGSLIQPSIAVSPEVAALLVGCIVETTFLLSTSVAYGATARPLGQFFDVGEGLAVSPVRDVLLAGGSMRLVSFRATINQAILTSLVLRPYLQVSGSNPAVAGGEFAELVDHSYRVVASATPTRSAASINIAWLHSRLAARGDLSIAQAAGAPLAPRVRSNSLTATPSGAAIGSLIASAVAPSASNRTAVYLAGGTYNQAQTVGNFFGFVDLVGRDSMRAVIDGTLAANTPPATITAQSTLECYWPGDIENVTVIAQDKRYGMHTDLISAPLIPTDVTVRWSHIEHRGNARSQAYQNSIGSGVTVWQSPDGWGCGVWGDWTLRSEFSTFIADRCAVAVHNNLSFHAPARTEHYGSRLVTTSAAGAALELRALGSGTPDKAVLIGNSFGGPIRTSYPTWLPTAPAQQPADHTEWRARGFANTPAAYYNDDWGLALCITSADTTSASSVTVGGNAVPYLFGRGAVDPTPDLPVTIATAGGGGIPATRYGWGDRSGTMIGPNFNVASPTLASMLGDCTGAAKTLNVTFQGSTTRTLTFNQNYTNQNNSAIEDLINAAITGLGTASLFSPGSRYRPVISDEEVTRVNTGAAGIPMGAPAAYDADGSRTIRLMTPSDPPWRFAGVAWENIVPGAAGRLKFRGFLHVRDLQLVGLAGTLALGTLIGVTSSGTWTTNPTIPVLRALSSDTVDLDPRSRIMPENVALTGGTIDGVAIGSTARAQAAVSRLGVGAAVSSGADIVVQAATAWGPYGQGLGLLVDGGTLNPVIGFASYGRDTWFAVGNNAGTFRLDRMAAPGTTSTAPQPLIGVDQGGALQMGASLATVIDANQHVRLRKYPRAGLPTPATNNIGWAQVTNPEAGKTLTVYCSGTSWVYSDNSAVTIA